MGGEWFKRARSGAASKAWQLERARQRAMARRKCHREAKVLTKALLREGFHTEEVIAAVAELVTATEAAVEEAREVLYGSRSMPSPLAPPSLIGY